MEAPVSGSKRFDNSPASVKSKIWSAIKKNIEFALK